MNVHVRQTPTQSPSITHKFNESIKINDSLQTTQQDAKLLVQDKLAQAVDSLRTDNWLYDSTELLVKPCVKK